MNSKGRYLVSASEDGYIVVWDCVNPSVFKNFEATALGISSINQLLVLENEKNFVIGNDTGINIIDIVKGEEVKPSF